MDILSSSPSEKTFLTPQKRIFRRSFLKRTYFKTVIPRREIFTVLTFRTF